jgi:hypothetical protein
MRTRILPAALAAIAQLAVVPIAYAEGPPVYRVTKTVALGAPDRWDLVAFDPRSKRVFVAHGDWVTAVGRIYIAAGDVDPNVLVAPGKRPTLVPGSLKLLLLDPGR